ncbi:MAG TPA: sugar phosphate nucleotidyltransferase [Thermomicrobiales bacterium]|nr:sugar phosphate nucleotidyltransferase [Thermomicrobiales bacterium]
MDIILPVAGLGTRLRPQTWTKPKPLVSLAGKPMLAHALDQVLPVGPEQIIFITGFLGDQIEIWARESLDVPVAFVTQPEMRGQTDAILRTRGLVERDALILFPDMLFEAEFAGLEDVDADVVMFTKEVEDPSALGIAVVEQDRIVRLIEKPQEPISNLAVIGIYYVRNMEDLYTAIEEQMHRGMALKNEYYIADAIQIMIDRGARVISRPVTTWEDCGNADALLSSNRSHLERHNPTVGQRDGSVIIAPSYVAEDAIIVNSVIGPFASIAGGAVIRGSIVRDSIIESGVEICGATLEQSIVGRRVSVHGFRGRLNVGDDAVVGL